MVGNTFTNSPDNTRNSGANEDVNRLSNFYFFYNFFMSEEQMKHFLEEAIVFHAQEEGVGVDLMSFSTAGVLTNNKGLVVRIGGAEFQLTIVKTR